MSENTWIDYINLGLNVVALVGSCAIVIYVGRRALKALWK